MQMLRKDRDKVLRRELFGLGEQNEGMRIDGKMKIQTSNM